MKHLLKKSILVIILGTMVAFPFSSSAFWGFGDIALDPIQDESGIATQISQVTQVVNQVQMVLKAFGLDVVIYKVSQKLSQKLLTKVLNKANGGADGEGSKLFVENFQQYFQDISKQQLTEYTDSLSNSSSPFARSISIGIANQAGGDRGSSKSLLESFSLGDYLPDGVKWQDAANDLAAAGDNGLDFYAGLAQPQNTPLGAAIIAQDDLAKKINSAKDIAKTELTSSGFVPDKEISKYRELFADLGVSKPKGETSGGPSAESPGRPSETAAGTTYYEPGGNPNDSSATGAPNNASNTGIPFQTTESFSSVNLDGKIKTPAKTNEDQSGQAVVESFDRLRNADSFGKILFSTIQQMITGLIQKGFSKLGSDGGVSEKLYGGPQDINRVLNSNLSWSSAPQQVVDLRNSLDIGIQKTQLEIDAIQKTIDSVKKPLSDNVQFSNGVSIAKGTILSLEFCIPGPDTGFDRRLTDYMTEQTRDTQQKASLDNDRGTANSESLIQIRRDVTQAIAEQKALIANPFFNIPGANGMKSVLNDYYKSAKRFRSLLDTLILKRQILNNLQVLRSEAQAEGALANDTVPLILFDTQWNKLSTAQKTSLYTGLTPNILANFPEYSTESATGATELSALPANNPATAINERDNAMKDRILAEQWDEWETKVSDENKQKLYSRYIGLTQDISDSASVQKAQVLADGTDELYKELQDVLSDCRTIRNYLLTHPTAVANDQNFIDTLKSGRIKTTYTSPSILTAAENGVDFEKANERLLGGISSTAEDQFGLQVPNLAKTPATIFQQDSTEELYCRLMNYELNYWNLKQVSGGPIGCKRTKPPISITGNDGVTTQKVKPEWYHTNNGEILFQVNDEE